MTHVIVNSTSPKRKAAQLSFAVISLVSFLLPWVNWDGFSLQGFGMPAGIFFDTAEKAGGPSDPFPQLAFGLYVFWLIPALAVLSFILVLLKKQAATLSFISASLGLSLVTIYILFTLTMMDLGIGNKLSAMLQPGIFLHITAAIGLIVSAFPVKNGLVKLAWLFAGPVLAYTGYSIGEHYIMNETHVATQYVKTDYTITAADLLKEFAGSDTATNKKYLDKTLLVKGNVALVTILADSTSTIQFEDSTGSYIIFSVEKNELNNVKNIKKGDAISLKGVCSGSIFSEILGTTSVTFKRATLK